MGGNYNVSQVTYQGPGKFKGQSDARLMKNLDEDEHQPENPSDIKKSFETMQDIPYGTWPRASKI